MSDWSVRGPAAAAALAMLWFAAVTTLSTSARERRLVPGEEKSFWGPDPHLHVSVAEVRWNEGDLPGQARRCGVTLCLRSEAMRVRVSPSKLRATLIDAKGNRFEAVSLR